MLQQCQTRVVILSRWIAVLCLLVLLSGCSKPNEDLSQANPNEDLSRAKSLRIRYGPAPTSRRPEEPKTLTISDPEEVSKLLSHMAIKSVRKGAYSHRYPYIELYFSGDDGEAIETKFVEPDVLERLNWGVITLKGPGFYEKVCELITKAEGAEYDPHGEEKRLVEEDERRAKARKKL